MAVPIACYLGGCDRPRRDGIYCADHAAKLGDPHWIPCRRRDGRIVCAWCGADVIPARHRDRPDLIAALERHDGGTVQIVDGNQFVILADEWRASAIHDGIVLYRSHGPACERRPNPESSDA